VEYWPPVCMIMPSNSLFPWNRKEERSLFIHFLDWCCSYLNLPN
jgi:hypothetical protein